MSRSFFEESELDRMQRGRVESRVEVMAKEVLGDVNVSNTEQRGGERGRERGRARERERESSPSTNVLFLSKTMGTTQTVKRRPEEESMVIVWTI